MAGDITKRSSYLKTLVASHVIRDSGYGSMSDSLREGYLHGPGLKLRNFALWAEDNYPAVGTPRGNLYGQPEIAPALFGPLVPHDANQTLNVQRVEVQSADFSYWAEQWMLIHSPELLDTAWTSDYDDATGDVIITFEDLSTVEFHPTDFVKSATYVYVLYNLITGAETGATTVGDLSYGAYPSTTGWTSVSSSTSTDTRTLGRTEKTTKSYSDGRPDEVTTTSSTSTDSYQYYRAVLTKTDYQGTADGSLDQLYSIVSTLRLFRDGSVYQDDSTTTTTDDIGGGVTRTTKVDVTQDVLSVQQSWRIDTKNVSQQTFSPARLLVYRLGSGVSPALDAKLLEQDDDGFYFPFIPVRLDNVPVDAAHFPELYDENKKAYKKLTGSRKYDDDVMKQIAENKSVKDMDYVYIMLGASLNTKENAAKKYLYEFFDRLRLSQQVGSASYAAWQADQDQFTSDNEAWLEWRAAQDDPGSPLYGTTMPTTGTTYAAPSNEVRIRGAGTVATNVDMSITWQSITRSTGTGHVKPGAKAGNCFVDYISRDQYNSSGYTDGNSIGIDPIAVDRVVIRRQLTVNTWESLNIIGLTHRNYIYKGKFVEISGKDALADTEESGFLVPLHFDVFKSLSIVDSSQLSTACVYMVINSYKVVKTGFFGSTFFKIFLVVAVIAITVATGGTGGASVGLLGTNAAVGAALGVSGTLAIIVGAVANAIVAMVLLKVISVGATAIFGAQLGAIIGAIAGLVALQVGVSLQSGSSLATSFGALMKADNIIALTSSVGNGVAGYIQAGAAETIAKTQDLQKDYETRSAEISRLYEQNIGYDRASLDPLLLLGDGGLNYVEGASAFLQRTLMTGSDVADLSLTMLSNFSDITLSTDLDY